MVLASLLEINCMRDKNRMGFAFKCDQTDSKKMVPSDFYGIFNANYSNLNQRDTRVDLSPARVNHKHSAELKLITRFPNDN